MADPSQGSMSSIKARIAALNLEEVHAPAPGLRPAYSYDPTTAKKKAPPPPPPAHRPPVQQRGRTINNPPVYSNAATNSMQLGNQPIAPAPDTPKMSPSLPPRPPPRTNSQQPPSLPPRNSPANSLSRRGSLESISTISSIGPRLPPRKSSEHSMMRRRDSNESISTVASVGSAKTSMSGTSNGGTLYQIRAPAFDPSKLPPILPKKAPAETRTSATLTAMKSNSKLKAPRALPPQLPSRPLVPARNDSQTREPARSLSENRHALPQPRQSALSFGMNKSTEIPPPLPSNRPTSSNSAEPGAPPPIPIGSRPNLHSLMASKPKAGAVGQCLKCRDFSAPDSHAAQFPRQNLPSSDVGWLAAQLTGPFSSPTDKARAIFTWLHHNVEYDVHSFFGGTISASTPERTITSGLAVCEGYASLFTALALKAGLESVVVGGHGKGFGHSALNPGDPIPEFNANHAWSAVRIDNGEWKLCDPCWGAGNVKGANEGYEKSFKAFEFTMDNDEFGTKHYPSDNAYFFRTDGRPSISWQEYMLDDVGERLTVYGCAMPEHGLGQRTFQPAAKHIKVFDPRNEPTIRFQFASVCPHWNSERHGKGKPYLMVLHIGGRDGRKTDWIPFQNDGKANGTVWWLDVDRTDLGAPGQRVSVFAVTTFDGRDGRGLSASEYRAGKGRVAMAWSGVAMWELV